MSASEVILTSRDGTPVTIEREVLRRSLTFTEMCDRVEVEVEVVPVEMCSAESLEKLVEWLNKNHKMDVTDLSKLEPTSWNFIFFRNLSPSNLAEILETSRFLQVSDLYKMACKMAAKRIIGKTIDQIREELEITDDFPKAEKQRVKKSITWCQRR